MDQYKVGFGRNGALRLPPGFRFHPTDEELVVQYLRRKIMSSPLPASFIPDVEVCKSDPWDLPGDTEHERYFFSTREAKYPNGNRSNRATVSGYWKATGIDRQIMTSKGSQLVGMKKTLVFYRGKPPSGAKTDWIMHEYRLASPDDASPRNARQKMNLNQSPEASAENWVLCRIFLKKRSSFNSKNEEGAKVEEHEDEEVVPKARSDDGKPVFYEFITGRNRTMTDLNLAPCSSSSGSSGLTNISSNRKAKAPEDHEESSSCNSLNLICQVTKP